MEIKFTRGPWGCSYTSNHAHDYRLTKPDGYHLPLTVIANDHNEQKANAHLIAMAPDMYEVLSNIVNYFTEPRCKDDWITFYKEMVEPAEHVLAKARGE